MSLLEPFEKDSEELAFLAALLSYSESRHMHSIWGFAIVGSRGCDFE